MKKLLIIAMLLVLPLVATSCYYDELPYVPVPASVSYAADIQPIFNQNCINCHNGSIPLDLRSGQSYNELINQGYVIANDPSASVLYKSFTGNGAALMPPAGSLSTNKIETVKKWIENGALNN